MNNRQEDGPTPGQLNLFMAVWLLTLAVAGALALYHGSPAVAAALGCLALLPLLLRWVAPRGLAGLWQVSAWATLPLRMAVSWLLLALLYLLVVTPLGLGLRLAGYDPLRLRPRGREQSYWEPHAPADEPERYFRQF